MNLKDKIKRVLADNKLATLSTLDQENCRPEAALLAFVENSELELFFQTSSKTRKYSNLLSNNNAALVIGFGFTNIQYEGTVQQVLGKKELEMAKLLFAKKESPAKQAYLDLPDTVIFKVSPKWIGYRNYDKHPPEIAEIKL